MKHWLKPAIILGIITIVLGIIYQVVTSRHQERAIAIQQHNRQNDLDREDERRRQAEWDARPYLAYVNHDQPKNGRTSIQYHNRSLVKKAVISFISLDITEPAQLTYIAKFYPRTPPLIGAAPDKGQLNLIHGDWNEEGTRYTFWVNPQFEVEKDSAFVFETCIIDPKFPTGTNFKGEFRLEVDGGEAESKAGIVIPTRRP